MMKKLLLIKSLILISTLGFSQSNILNSGFENWTEVTTFPPVLFNEPDGWSYHICGGPTSGPYTCDLLGERTSDAYSGNYALKVKNTTNNFGQVVLASNGTVGQNFTVKPSAMNLYVKNSLINNDYLRFTIVFYGKLNNVTVSKSIKDSITVNNSSYTKHSIPITLDFEPLILLTNISLRNTSNTKNLNSFALIDDISFDLVSGIENEKLETDLLTFYPNPVINELNLSKEVNYTLSNMYGQAIASGFGDKINTSTLSKGIYLLQYQNSDNKKMTKTFVKE